MAGQPNNRWEDHECLNEAKVREIIRQEFSNMEPMLDLKILRALNSFEDAIISKIEEKLDAIIKPLTDTQNEVLKDRQAKELQDSQKLQKKAKEERFIRLLTIFILSTTAISLLIGFITWYTNFVRHLPITH